MSDDSEEKHGEKWTKRSKLAGSTVAAVLLLSLLLPKRQQDQSGIAKTPGLLPPATAPADDRDSNQGVRIYSIIDNESFDPAVELLDKALKHYFDKNQIQDGPEAREVLLKRFLDHPEELPVLLEEYMKSSPYAQQLYERAVKDMREPRQVSL